MALPMPWNLLQLPHKALAAPTASPASLRESQTSQWGLTSVLEPEWCLQLHAGHMVLAVMLDKTPCRCQLKAVGSENRNSPKQSCRGTRMSGLRSRCLRSNRTLTIKKHKSEERHFKKSNTYLFLHRWTWFCKNFPMWTSQIDMITFRCQWEQVGLTELKHS